MTMLRKTFPINAETDIPAVGFGTFLISPQDAPKAVEAALTIGYRHVDTAAVYQNEEAVGVGIRNGLRSASLSRQTLFVTAKLWPGRPEQTADQCDATLARLSLDYVDLYLIHSPQGGPQRVPQWEALLDLKRAGKARAVGVSNFSQKHLREIEAAGLPMPEANQVELHPWSQKPDLISYMRSKDIAPIAYSSLAPLSTWRAKPGQSSAKTEEMKRDGGVFVDMARKYGVTEAQLLLRWGIQNGYAVLPKSLNPDRMRQNIDLGGFAIDDADMELIATMDRGGGIAWSNGDPSLVD